MQSKLTKTRHPGIYKRGNKYVVVYRDRQRRQKKETVDTLADAQHLKAERVAAVRSGTHRELSKETFAEYAPRWIEAYNGKRGGSFRDHTRAEYRRMLNRYVIPYFGGLTLAEISTADVREFGKWLHNDDLQGRIVAEAKRDKKAKAKGVSPDSLPLKTKPVTLADNTVLRIVTTLSAAMSTAVNDGLIDRNPVRDAAIPKRDQERAIAEGRDGEDEKAKAMTDAELSAFLRACPDEWQTFFRLLAGTGLRWSEAIALTWRDLHLDADQPTVRVTKAYVKGKLGLPKSKQSKRSVPMGADLVGRLKALRVKVDPDPKALVFPSRAGTYLRHENVRRRVLLPTARQAGLLRPDKEGKPVTWLGFHTFRHTCATRLFMGGRNAKQVQRWLGHHSPAFTLERYVHLLDDALGDPLDAPDVFRPERAAVDEGQGGARLQLVAA